MSQDPDAEDVKPKLNLVINYEGQRGSPNLRSCAAHHEHDTDITVKVKQNMPFRKIFEAAEVRDVVACGVVPS